MRALLEKQLGCPHHRLVGEACTHLAAGEHVGERDEQHSLVVRHVGAHDGGALAVGDAGGRVIEGLVEAVAAASAIGVQTSEIPNRFLGVHHRREPGRIGRDHDVHAQASLQAEARDTKGRILVRSLEVEGVVG